MGESTNPVRGPRTRSSIAPRGGRSKGRHIHQFKLGSLELERSRLQGARESFLQGIRRVEARLVQIEAEIHAQRRILGYTAAALADTTRAAAGCRGESKRPGSRLRKILRY